MGGVNQVVMNLAFEAVRRGRVRPIVFCADWEQKAFVQHQADGLTMVCGRLRSPLSAEGSWRPLAPFFRDLRAQLKDWRSLIAQHNIRAINAHYPGLYYSIFPLLRGSGPSGVRLIFSLHGADLSGLRDAGAVQRRLGRQMLAKADAVTCCSGDLARRAQQELGLKPELLHTNYNGIDVSELDRNLKNRFRPQTGEFDSYLISVGTYEHKKGQDVLLQAYTRLVRRGLKSALVLVGRSTPYLATLRGLVRQLGLQQHVFFLPDLDHASTLAAIRGARLLVQPSREEPFGITLLEAGYLETPIVATRCGGIPEVLGAYYPYLAPPDDATALAEAIDEAMFNPTDVTREVRLIKRRVSTRFTWGTAYADFEALWLR